MDNCFFPFNKRINILATTILILFLLNSVVPLSKGGYADSTKGLEPPVEVRVGVRLLNLEKVEISSSTFTIDFYIWFEYDPEKIDSQTVDNFEFLNGAPTLYLTTNDPVNGFTQYRVHGTFISSLNCREYPFDSYTLPVIIEHKNLNATYLLYTNDPSSNIDKDMNNIGWNISNFTASSYKHRLTSEEFSDYSFSITASRPILNSAIKYVLPIFVITLISFSTFFLKPKQFGERVAITVTTLISASAMHINSLNGLPPTAYLTIADKIYLAVYTTFLANLAVSVYVMRLVDQGKLNEATSFNDQSLKMLILLIIVLFTLLSIL